MANDITWVELQEKKGTKNAGGTTTPTGGNNGGSTGGNGGGEGGDPLSEKCGDGDEG